MVTITSRIRTTQKTIANRFSRVSNFLGMCLFLKLIRITERGDILAGDSRIRRDLIAFRVSRSGLRIVVDCNEFLGMKEILP